MATASGAPLTGVKALAAGNLFTCALSEVGNVQCWGNNSAGQLGDGQDGRSTPPEPFRANPNDLTSNILDASAAAITAGAGGGHTCALIQDNTARCWGDDSFGQLGISASVSGTWVNTPMTVTTVVGNPPNTVTLTQIKVIAAGDSHTCALMNDGTVQCWGLNNLGQLGRNTTSCPAGPTPPAPGTLPCSVPQPVLDRFGNPLRGVQEISAGGIHTCALMNDGTVQCWGLNDSGQLGPAVPVGDNSVSVSPVTVAEGNCNPVTDPNCSPLSGVAHIVAGEEHTCAALLAGGIRCWGLNGSGQLGASTGRAFRIAVPVIVGGLCNCPGPIMYCNGQCTDTTTDPHNCGGCNSPCTSGTCCSGGCTDTASDPENCGRCNKACLTGENCVASA